MYHFWIEISAEKTMLMTNSAESIKREIKVKGQELGIVRSFKYFGAVVSDEGPKAGGSLKDCQKDCISDKAEANVEI